MTKRRKTGGRSRAQGHGLFYKSRSAESRRLMSWFSARLKQVELHLKRHWVVVRGILIFSGCILLFLFIYSRLVDSELLEGFRAFTASATGFVLSLFGANIQVIGTMVSSPDFSMGIIAVCTGIVPMAIFTSAVLAYPCTLRQKGEGMALGIPVLFSLNLVRMVSLFLVGTHLPGLFDIAHYIVWQSLMVLLAIGLWLFWVEKLVHVAPH